MPVHCLDAGRHHHPAGAGQRMDAAALEQQFQELRAQHGRLRCPAHRGEHGGQDGGEPSADPAEARHHLEGRSVKQRRVDQLRAARHSGPSSRPEGPRSGPCGAFGDDGEVRCILARAAELATQRGVPARGRLGWRVQQVQVTDAGLVEADRRAEPDAAQQHARRAGACPAPRPGPQSARRQVQLHDGRQQRHPVHAVVSEERVNIRIDLYLQLPFHLPGQPTAVVSEQQVYDEEYQARR